MTPAVAAPRLGLTLYINGASPCSMRAVANLRRLCDRLGERAELEIVDVREHPARVLRDQILAVPTLIKRFPAPTRVLVGDLSDTDEVSLSLDLPAEPVR